MGPGLSEATPPGIAHPVCSDPEGVAANIEGPCSPSLTLISPCINPTTTLRDSVTPFGVNDSSHLQPGVSSAKGGLNPRLMSDTPFGVAALDSISVMRECVQEYE